MGGHFHEQRSNVMGDRLILTVKCSECGHEDDDVYYAPTCGFTHHHCVCGNVIDLEEFTGITAEDLSNADEIKKAIDDLKSNG